MFLCPYWTPLFQILGSDWHCTTTRSSQGNQKNTHGFPIRSNVKSTHQPRCGVRSKPHSLMKEPSDKEVPMEVDSFSSHKTVQAHLSWVLEVLSSQIVFYTWTSDCPPCHCRHFLLRYHLLHEVCPLALALPHLFLQEKINTFSILTKYHKKLKKTKNHHQFTCSFCDIIYIIGILFSLCLIIHIDATLSWPTSFWWRSCKRHYMWGCLLVKCHSRQWPTS